MDPDDDTSLMLRVRNGEVELLGVLFARYLGRVHALCYRLTGDAGSADDLAQEAFLRALRHRRTFRGEASFGTWIHRIARNVYLDHRKRARRRVAEESRYGERVHDRRAPMTDRSRFLRESLERLPEAQREALILSRYHGFTYAEIGRILDVSENAVKLRAQRGLRELRERMRDQESEHGLREEPRAPARPDHR